MKKLTSLLLTLTMLLSVGTAVLAADAPSKSYPQRFYDVPKDYWAFSYIAELVDRGVLEGYDDGSFKPEDTISRAEFAKIMVGAAGVPADDNSVYFTDMQGHWAIPYVNAAKDYLTAYSDNTYRPDQAAVREDVTMAMVKLKGYDVSDVDFSYLSDFTDTDSISNSIKKYVAVAVEKGLISGFEDNTFRGQATITRAEAATLLWRAFQYGSDNKVVDTPATDEAVTQTTVTPEPTATPTAIAKPTEEPTATPKPTEEPTPEPTEKPYKVDTLAKATVNLGTTQKITSGSGTYVTSDNNGTIYYTDTKKVYSLTADGEVTEILDSDVLTIEEDFEEYTFTIENICCDTNGDVYVTVYTKQLQTYMLCKVVDGFVEGYIGEARRPIFILDKNYITIGRVGDSYYVIGLSSFEGSEGVVITEGVPICATEYDDNIIVADPYTIYKYDYNTATEIASGYSAVGLSNNGYVIEKDGKFIIRSFDGEQEIKFSLDDCDVNDKTALNANNLGYNLFLMPDNSVVFYDTSAKAFRIISEND